MSISFVHPWILLFLYSLYKNKIEIETSGEQQIFESFHRLSIILRSWLVRGLKPLQWSLVSMLRVVLLLEVFYPLERFSSRIALCLTSSCPYSWAVSQYLLVKSIHRTWRYPHHASQWGWCFWVLRSFWVTIHEVLQILQTWEHFSTHLLNLQIVFWQTPYRILYGSALLHDIQLCVQAVNRYFHLSLGSL